MGGDELSILLFLVGTGVAAVMGAMQTAGWRSRAFWGVALVCAVAALAFLRAATTDQEVIGLRTAWALAPFLAVLLSLLAVSGREPRKPTPKPLSGTPAVNPALTAEYLNGLVAGATELEAKRRIETLSNQRARVKGQVKDISEGWSGLTAHVAGLVSRYGNWWIDTPEQKFRKDQSAALEAIKREDWIEFTGKVEHSGLWGWRLTDCEFVGRAEPPPKPKVRRRASGQA